MRSRCVVQPRGWQLARSRKGLWKVWNLEFGFLLGRIPGRHTLFLRIRLIRWPSFPCAERLEPFCLSYRVILSVAMCQSAGGAYIGFDSTRLERSWQGTAAAGRAGGALKLRKSSSGWGLRGRGAACGEGIRQGQGFNEAVCCWAESTIAADKTRTPSFVISYTEKNHLPSAPGLIAAGTMEPPFYTVPVFVF